MANLYLRASGNWSDPSIWSATSGGAGGAGVPTSSDSVYIDKNYTVTLTADATCQSLSMTNGVVNISGYILTCDYGLSMGNGATTRTLNMGNGTLVLNFNGIGPAFFVGGSNWTINSGTSLLIINGGKSNNQDYFTTGNAIFNDVQIRLGEGNSYAGGINITGSPTFRLLDIRSANDKAHTVNFDDNYIYVDKFVAVGSSASQKLTLAGPSAGNAVITLSGDQFYQKKGTSYGQFVNISNVYTDADLDTNKYYIGSNSTDNTANWLLQDPPKISTLVDPLTTDPASNTNWAVTGTVTKVTTGHDGGGYSLASGARIVSTDTYDLTDSTMIFERTDDDPASYSSSTYFGVVGLGDYSTSKSAVAISRFKSTMGPPFYEVIDVSSYSDGNTESGAMFYYPLSVSKYVKLSLSSTAFTSSYSDDGVTWTTATTKTIASDDLTLLKSARLIADGVQFIGSINPSLISAPAVSTGAVTNLANTTVTLAGNVTSDGGATITERGIVYSTSPNPTTSAAKVTTSGTTGSYTVSVTGLLPNTLYYFRAYAINSEGTAYGSNQSFTTLVDNGFALFF